jgi:hypothetical protein
VRRIFSYFTVRNSRLLTDQVYLIERITVDNRNNPGVMGEKVQYVITCLRIKWTCNIRKCHTATQNVGNQEVILCFQMSL